MPVFYPQKLWTSIKDIEHHGNFLQNEEASPDDSCAMRRIILAITVIAQSGDSQDRRRPGWRLDGSGIVKHSVHLNFAPSASAGNWAQAHHSRQVDRSAFSYHRLDYDTCRVRPRQRAPFDPSVLEPTT
jgi:hypothetical protein